MMNIPFIGTIGPDSGMIELEERSDGQHRPGENGVQSVISTGRDLPASGSFVRIDGTDKLSVSAIKRAEDGATAFTADPTRLLRCESSDI